MAQQSACIYRHKGCCSLMISHSVVVRAKKFAPPLFYNWAPILHCQKYPALKLENFKHKLILVLEVSQVLALVLHCSKYFKERLIFAKDNSAYWFYPKYKEFISFSCIILKDDQLKVIYKLYFDTCFSFVVLGFQVKLK